MLSVQIISEQKFVFLLSSFALVTLWKQEALLSSLPINFARNFPGPAFTAAIGEIAHAEASNTPANNDLFILFIFILD